MTTIRAFLSVNLGIEVLRAISVAQREARQRCAAAGWDIAWVPPPNVHVLLRYLGEISVALPHPLVTALRPHVEPLSPFPLRARGLRAITVEATTTPPPPEGPAPEGAAGAEAAAPPPEAPPPEASRPAVVPPTVLPHTTRLVVPIIDESGGLDRLQTALATALGELGFKPPEPRPVTEVVVARVVTAGPSPLEPLLAPAAELDFGSSLVTEVLLYKSTAHAPKGEFVRLGYAALLGHAPELADAARRAAPAQVAATLPAAVDAGPEPPELDDEPLEDAAEDLAEPQIVVLAEPDAEDLLEDEVVGDEDDGEPDDEEEPPPEA